MKKPSVTYIIENILKPDGGGYQYVAPDVMEYAALRGKYVHEAIEWWHKGELDEASLDPVIKPYLEAYKRYCADTGWVALRFEVELETAGYQGHLDQMGFYENKDGSPPTIMEIKTAVPMPSHEVQVVAYANLWDACDNQIDTEARVLYLKPNGKYHPVIITPLKRQKHLTAFLGALQVHYWREEYLA